MKVAILGGTGKFGTALARRLFEQELADEAFRDGRMTTGLIAERGDALLTPPMANPAALRLAASALLRDL